MKTIGLIGGMSWESTVPYYRIINETMRQRLGGLHSARCVLWSFDFQEIEVLQHRGDWDALTRHMIDAAQAVERAGAGLLVICTNTMHKMADEVQAAVDIPLLHIADATADAVRAAGINKVGLLATRFTMEEDFYKGRLTDKHRLEVLIPDGTERQLVHQVIYNELCSGCINEHSRERFQAIIERMARAGAEGVILGCTEIGLLIRPGDSSIPLFDTTTIHARAAADFALA
jgi:aspartate racemase